MIFKAHHNLLQPAELLVIQSLLPCLCRPSATVSNFSENSNYLNAVLARTTNVVTFLVLSYLTNHRHIPELTQHSFKAKKQFDLSYPQEWSLSGLVMNAAALNWPKISIEPILCLRSPDDDSISSFLLTGSSVCMLCLAGTYMGSSGGWCMRAYALPLHHGKKNTARSDSVCTSLLAFQAYFKFCVNSR